MVEYIDIHVFKRRKPPVCGCLISFYNPYAKLCSSDNCIYVGHKCNENNIVKILNHEYVHYVMHLILSEDEDGGFDNLFDGLTTVGFDGTPKCKIDFGKKHMKKRKKVFIKK